MIVEALLNVLFGVISLVVSLFNFPDLPDSIANVYQTFLQYLQGGLKFLFFFFNPSTLKTCTAFIISIYAISKAVDLFLWVWQMLHGNVEGGD